MKFALIHVATGAVLQWQDHAKLAFAEPGEGTALYKLADAFEFPSEARWLVNGSLTAQEPYQGPPQPPAITAEHARLERDERLRLAAIRIAPLQDAVDIGEATSADTALLAQWKKYRVDLNRIEASQGFPETIVWPKPPQ